MRLRSFLIEGVQKKMPRSTIADTQSKTKISKNRSAVQNKIYGYKNWDGLTIHFFFMTLHKILKIVVFLYENFFEEGRDNDQYCEDHNFWDKKCHVASSCAGCNIPDDAATQVEDVAEPKGAQCVNRIDIEEVVDLLKEIVRQQKRQFPSS